MKKIHPNMIAAIRAALDQQTTVNLLSYIGYQVDRNNKFCLREENTPSVSIRADGYIKDFGSGWGGDFISVLCEFKNMTFIEAILWTADALGIEVKYE
ncbi:MAG: CHC2 zinc finger domain-containing protein [Candidatus Cloacimonadota bacterium]|nr:CHC2 zinc finger domain-containing protein [Candidatus Cloacimonadota bacterium]